MLIITHPNPPGLGELTVLRSEGQTGFESAIDTCSHCQRAVQIHAKDIPYGFCRKCNHVICEFCAPKYVTDGCLPFRALIEQYQEAQYRSSNSYPLAG